MITQAIDPHHYVRRARQIKAQIPLILSKWGLLPKFTRWRLAQDPETGTVVLFGVLDTQYIAVHATTPFSNYFDPRLLSDLEAELHVQILPSSNDGLRYAFILELGELNSLPAPSEPLDHEAVSPSPDPHRDTLPDDRAILHQRLDKFLKVTEALEALDAVTPDVLQMDDAEFNQQMADYEASRNTQKPL